MTRIVAGTAGGRKLAVPAGDGTRPTTDRAREAMFSTLGSLIDLVEARVLDLYAGSGALGLEALSRGAASAVLVDSGPRALAALRSNVAALGLSGATVMASDAAAYPARADGEEFDLVLLDPPYAVPSQDVTTLLGALVEHGRLADDAVVVVERPTRGTPLTWPDGLLAVRSRRYGEATLWYGRRP